MAKKTVNYLMENKKESARLALKVDEFEFVNKFLIQRLKKVNSFIDIACGPGVILKAIGQRFPHLKITGIDNSKKRVKDARKTVKGFKNIRIIQGNAYKLPLKEKFDFVFSRFLFEFLKEPEKVIKEMLRISKPGGIIFLQDLDGQLLWHYPVNKRYSI